MTTTWRKVDHGIGFTGCLKCADREQLTTVFESDVIPISHAEKIPKQQALRCWLIAAAGKRGVMSTTIKCPKCEREIEVPLFTRNKPKVLRNKLQHHLYMSHNIGVIESHELADEAVNGGKNGQLAERPHR